MTSIAAPAIGYPSSRSVRTRSPYDYVGDGIRRGLFLRILLLVAPIQSVLLLDVQGSTPAFLLVLSSIFVLAGADLRYAKLLLFCLIFLIVYTLYLAISLSGYMIDYPDPRGLIFIRNIFVYGELRQSSITQGLYLFTAMLFAFLVYVYYQEAFVKYAFYGILFLAAYGLYEFAFFYFFEMNGDFLSNRNFGDLELAAAGAGEGAFATGSMVQQSNLFGEGFMRLKSLVGEPSMYALTVVPFTVYAFAQRWWAIFAILLLTLVLSAATTGIVGLAIGLGYVEARRRPEFILYLIMASVAVGLLYLTSDTIAEALNNLLFKKLASTSGVDRMRSLLVHTNVVLDGNLIRAFFGLGWGTVRSTDMFSNIIANVGMLGLILYSAALLGPCVLLKRSFDKDAIIASLLSIYFMEMLTVSEYAYLPPWFMVALGYARARQERRQQVMLGQ